MAFWGKKKKIENKVEDVKIEEDGTVVDKEVVQREEEIVMPETEQKVEEVVKERRKELFSTYIVFETDNVKLWSDLQQAFTQMHDLGKIDIRIMQNKTGRYEELDQKSSQEYGESRRIASEKKGAEMFSSEWILKYS